MSFFRSKLFFGLIIGMLLALPATIAMAVEGTQPEITTLGRSTTALPLFTMQQNLNEPMTRKLRALKLPEIFVKTEKWHTVQPPSEILYGNTDIGFFRSKNFKWENSTLTLTFIPPTYKRSIEFTAIHSDGKKTSLGKKLFKNPVGKDFEPFIDVQVRPSFPFFMIDWQWSKLFPVVINRLGEVVWIYEIPTSPEDTNATAYAFAEGGDFIFLRSDQNTFLIRMTPFGKIKKSGWFGHPSINLPNSHTVQYLPDTDEILFLSYECRELPWWKEFIPFMQGPLGWLRRFQLPRRSYRSGRLIQMSLKDFSYREIWNSYRTFSPDKNPSLASGFLNMADRFQDATTEDQYRLFLTERDFFTWCGWPERYASADWTHENSAQYIKGKGYLISIRNLNELIFLDENGRLKWRMGEGPENHDYFFPRDGTSFSMQHSAEYLKDGRILLYDNHTPYRGFSGIRHGNQLMIINVKDPGPIQPEWTFLLPNAHSDVRGSTTLQKNGRLFAYSAGNPGLPEVIWEIDPKESAVTGHIEIHNYSPAKNFESKPFWGFAGDTYVEGSTSETKAPSLTPKDSRDLLEFSY